MYLIFFCISFAFISINAAAMQEMPLAELSRNQTREAKQIIMEALIFGVEEPSTPLSTLHTSNLLKEDSEKTIEFAPSPLYFLFKEDINQDTDAALKNIISEILWLAAGSDESDRIDTLLLLNQTHLQKAVKQNSNIKNFLKMHLTAAFEEKLKSKNFVFAALLDNKKKFRNFFNFYTLFLTEDEQLESAFKVHEKAFIEKDNNYYIKDREMMKKDPILNAFVKISLVTKKVPFFMEFSNSGLYFPYVFFKEKRSSKVFITLTERIRSDTDNSNSIIQSAKEYCMLIQYLLEDKFFNDTEMDQAKKHSEYFKQIGNEKNKKELNANKKTTILSPPPPKIIDSNSSHHSAQNTKPVDASSHVSQKEARKKAGLDTFLKLQRHAHYFVSCMFFISLSYYLYRYWKTHVFTPPY